MSKRPTNINTCFAYEEQKSEEYSSGREEPIDYKDAYARPQLVEGDTKILSVSL